MDERDSSQRNIAPDNNDLVVYWFACLFVKRRHGDWFAKSDAMPLTALQDACRVRPAGG